MMEAALQLFVELDAFLRTVPIVRALVKSIVFAVLVYGVLGLIFYALEQRSRRDVTRYRTAHFWNDIAYTLVYQGGIYNIIIYAPLFALASSKLTFLQIGLLTHLPPLASIVIY